MSTTEEAFLAAITARPRDDGPRLIWADWLDESTDPAEQARAELIRLQCALARLHLDHPRRLDLVIREAELLHVYGDTWAKPVAGLAVGYEFHRGLLEAVSVEAGTFLTHGEELFDRAPVRRVRILDAGRWMPKLVNSPLLMLIRELDFCGNDLGNGDVNLLLRSAHLRNLVALDLSFNGLSDDAVRTLSRTEICPRLRSLTLSNNANITSLGVGHLAASVHLPQLRFLDLSENQITHIGLQALLAATGLPHLEMLDIHGNPLGASGVQVLTESGLFARMMAKTHSLDLRRCDIGPTGAMILATCEHLQALSRLDLGQNDLCDLGVMRLAESPHLGHLKQLHLARNRITDAGAVLLARSALMPHLTRLDVSANQITQRGIDELWANRHDFQTQLDTSGNLGEQRARSVS
jgi:uncharacterized protein (TIGR02996 family)